MKQILVRKGKVLVGKLPVPVVDKGCVLIKVINSCISAGTELSNLKVSSQSLVRRALSEPENVAKVLRFLKEYGIKKTFDKVRGRLESAVPTGYSVSGIVVGLGDGVDNFHVGDYVAAGGAGYANHAEYVVVPKNLVVAIPKGVSFEQAATVTLGAIALQGVRRADLRIGEYCVVFGTGILGLLSLQILAASGVRVIAVDIDDRRLSIARDLGAELTINTQNEDPIDVVLNYTGGWGADAVLFTAHTSSSEPLAVAFGLVRKKGCVILVGVAGSQMQIARELMYKKELDFKISTSYGPGRYDKSYEEDGIDYPYPYVRWTENRNMGEYLRLVADKKINVNTLIDRIFPIDQATEAFEYLKTASPRPLIVLLDYGQPKSEGEYKDIAPEGKIALDPLECKLEQKLERKVYINRPSTTEKDRVRLAIVGIGEFALSTHIPNLQKLRDKFHIRAIVNRSGYKAKNIAERIDDVEYITTDYDEVLADEDIDLVFISTQHNLHAEFTLKALQAGKNVFVEKPLAINREELERIKEFFRGCEDSDQIPLLMVGFNRRFSRHAQAIKDVVRGRINPLFIRYSMNAGLLPEDHWVYSQGGRIIGEMCHIIDLVTFLVGGRIISINCDFLSPRTARYKMSDNVSAILRYDDGSIAHIDYFSVGSREYSREFMDLHFDGKTVVLDNYKKTLGYGFNFTQVNTHTVSKGHLEELEVLYDALMGKGFWPISLEDMFQVSLASILIAENLILDGIHTESNEGKQCNVGENSNDKIQ